MSQKSAQTHSSNRSDSALGLFEFVILMALMMSLVAMSIDTMLPALSEIGQDLGSRRPQDNQLIVSMLILGMGIGQLFFGSLSDARGRKLAIQSGLLVFAVGTVISMFAPNMTWMLIGRVIQGIGVSGPRVVSMALIRDQYEGDAMARIMSFISMVFIIVPMIAPAIGQGILWIADWQAVFVLFLVISLIVALWLGIRQPETLPVNKRREFTWKNLWQATVFVFTHRQVMAYTLCAGFVFGAFLSYLGSSQLVFQSIYDVGESFSLFFALLAFSIGSASFINAKLVMKMGMLKLSTISLFGLILFAVALSGGALFYGGVPPLWIFVGLMMLMFFCVGILFGNLNALAMQPLGEMAGMGAAIIGSVTNVMAVSLSIVIGSFISTSVAPLSIGFAVCGLLSLISIKLAREAKKHKENA